MDLKDADTAEALSTMSSADHIKIHERGCGKRLTSIYVTRRLLTKWYDNISFAGAITSYRSDHQQFSPGISIQATRSLLTVPKQR
jgi:hypothetical protein